MGMVSGLIPVSSRSSTVEPKTRPIEGEPFAKRA